jgi:hypothetical protein
VKSHFSQERLSSWRSESNSKRRAHSPRERGRFIQLGEGHYFQRRRGSIQLKEGTIPKRRRGHAFLEIAALNVELTTEKREVIQHYLEVVQHHRGTKIEARGHNFLGVWLYKLVQNSTTDVHNIEILFVVKGTVHCRK